MIRSIAATSLNCETQRSDSNLPACIFFKRFCTFDAAMTRARNRCRAVECKRSHHTEEHQPMSTKVDQKKPQPTNPQQPEPTPPFPRQHLEKPGIESQM